MQIKDCIQSVLDNHEILDYIPNVNLTALGVNIIKDYHSRYIQDYLLLNNTNDTIANISDTIKYLTNILNRYKYSKLYATLNLEYNPIWNVDGVEVTEHLGTDTTSNVGSDTNTHTGTDSNTSTSSNTLTSSGSDSTSDTLHTDVTSNNVSKTNTQLKNTTNTNTTTSFNYGAGETTTTIDLAQKGTLTLNGGFDSSDYSNIKTGGNVDITANANKLVDSNLEITDNLNDQGTTETKTGGHTESTVGSANDNYTLSSGNADENYVEYEGIDTTDSTQSNTVTYGKSESGNETVNNQTTYNTTNATNSSNTETKSYNSSDKVTRQGNIGVTSTQSLIEQERQVSMFSLYDVIAKDIVDFICTADYWYC